jgi:hypothetical protein
LSLRDNGEFVFAGAFERPVVAGSDILDHRERMAFGIDSAFEQGHAVSTSCLFVVFDTHAVGPARAPLDIAKEIPSESLLRSRDQRGLVADQLM